jgi:hypothetical protein
MQENSMIYLRCVAVVIGLNAAKRLILRQFEFGIGVVMHFMGL